MKERRSPGPEGTIRELRKRSPIPGFIWPDYGGLCVTGVAPLILATLGLPATPPAALAALVGTRYRRVVLLIVDALGYRLMERCAEDVPALRRILERGVHLPVTSTFPSTTTVALTALYTGLTPVEHGITGHSMFLRGLGAVVDILRFSPQGDRRRDVYTDQGWDVRRIFPMRTVFEPLAEEGLAGISITRAVFRETALGRLHHAGAEVLGYLDLADMLAVTAVLLRTRREPGLLCVYWDTIDMLSHEYGPFSDAVRAAVAQVFAGVEREILSTLTAAERRETLLLIAADHGQTACTVREAICLDEHPEIVDSLLLPPAGQSRAAFLYALPRAVEQLPRQLEPFSDRVEIVTAWQGLARGIFGPPESAPNLDTRIGDLLTLARGGAQLLWVDHPRAQLRDTGRHGSLSEEEMLVPLIAMPLEAW